MSLCGSCTACCKVYAIPVLKKPAGQWCSHCAVGKGCKIYDSRPKICAQYECLWLQSQSKDAVIRFDAALRPDRSKVVLAPTTNPKIIGAITMPNSPDAWQRSPMLELLKKLVDGGFIIAIGAPAAATQLLWDRSGIRTVQMSAPDENGTQWRVA